MRVGLSLPGGPYSVAQHIEQIQQYETAGLDTVWSGQLFGIDILTVFALAGASTTRIRFGTGVIPTHSRHPLVLASQALTTQSATDGRLLLGVGSSHRDLVEGVLGASYERPAAHLREYLSLLPGLLRGERLQHEGEFLHVDTTTSFGRAGIRGTEAPPVYVGTMFPLSLKAAGTFADGVVTWLVGPATLAEQIIPIASEAARAAGRPRPRFVAGIPAAVCDADSIDEQRALVDRRLGGFTSLPVYERVLAREGTTSPADLAAIGDESSVAATLARYADAGVDEVYGMCFGDDAILQRTAEVLGALSSGAVHQT